MGLALDAELFTGPLDKAFPSVFLVFLFWYLDFGILVSLSFFVSVSLLKFTSGVFLV